MSGKKKRKKKRGMGSKFHYDIGMSKRTRRASDNNKQQQQQQQQVMMSRGGGFDEDQGEDENRKCLKEFIQGRSLSQHFSEEQEQQQQKELKLVKLQKQGFKLKSLLTRYGKVLTQFIKIKRNPDAFPIKHFPN